MHKSKYARYIFLGFRYLEMIKMHSKIKQNSNASMKPRTMEAGPRN